MWTVFGLDDDLSESGSPEEPPVGTFCNQPWSDFFARTGISESDLWAAKTPKCAFTARVFPIAKYIQLTPRAAC